ncbi:MAG: FAD-dependent oxidoreductase [Dehalococcoidales bacterium]|nr:FAD-dependent oxidoreductase [Dehalococcoidales bacterium]
METEPHEKTIREPAREIGVCREADVVVVGGGPGGIGAALAAARSGADTVLIERYGHLGGMASGGLVNIIPNLSDIYGEQHIAGICQELIDRMKARDAASFPPREFWGSSEASLVNYYLDANLRRFYIRKNLFLKKDIVLYTVLLDPEVLKDELNRMVEEAGVELYLHSWGVQAIIEDNCVKGIIIESKSGRQAIMGKVVIDSTGDGDVFISAGAEFISNIEPRLRISHLAFCFWIANVDLRKLEGFCSLQPEKHAELMKELAALGGFTSYFKGLLKNQENVIWFHPHVACSSQTDVKELTRVDMSSRRKALLTWEFLKKFIPGFERSYIMLTAPQLGTTGGTRIKGEYILSKKDMTLVKPFEDTVAVFASNEDGKVSMRFPRMYIPYRSLVPRRIEGLLVACRAFSSEDTINDHFNLIPHCLCFGQAAGTAAAMAVKNRSRVRDVNYNDLQHRLAEQGVILPSGA